MIGPLPLLVIRSATGDLAGIEGWGDMAANSFGNPVAFEGLRQAIAAMAWVMIGEISGQRPLAGGSIR